MTGQGKGEATVTYDDPASAQAAIQWFNGKACLTKKCPGVGGVEIFLGRTLPCTF